MGKQILRSRRNRVISGVCGGFAEYFNIDPTVVRLIWVAVSFTFGAGIIAYIIAAIIMPESKEFNSNDSKWHSETSSQGFDPGTNDWGKADSSYDKSKSTALVGGILVLVGVLFLARQMFHWFNFKYFWPVIFIIIGFLLIYRGRRDSL